VAGLVLLLVVLWTAPASAHAELVSASPSPGASVPQAVAVVLRFSEALNPSLSAITVTGPAGDATRGPAIVGPGSARVMRRPLALLRPGEYVVHWTSVSSDDGHTLQGSYRFAIATAAATGQHLRSGAVTAEGPLGLTGQLLVFTGLALWAGAVALRRRAEGAGVPRSRLAVLAHMAPTMTLAGSVLVVATSSGAGLDAGRAGAARLVVLAGSAVGVVAARRSVPYAAAAGTALIAEAVSGHVAAQSPVVGAALIAVHLVAVGIWLFAIAASLTSTAIIRTLTRLSRYAIGAAIVVGLTGVATATLEVASPTQLVGSGYGRFVLAKLAAFLLVAAAGAWHWRRRATGAAPIAVRRPVRVEATLSVGTLVVATLLSATAPPAPTPTPATVTTIGSPLHGLPRDGAVSVAQATGPYVVALTVTDLSARPGRVRVEILGSAAADGFRDVHVAGLVAGHRRFDTALVASDTNTFDGRAPVSRRGNWTFAVTFASPPGPMQVDFLVPLPAPSGGAELARALRAEGGLRSAQLQEDLRSTTAGPVISATYRFHAPDAISFTTTGSQEIDIGSRSFQRSQSSAPWTQQPASAAFRWPGPYFRDVWEPASEPRIVGTGVVDGAPSWIIAFVRPDLPAWFRIWVGISDGLVRREEMRAESHLMDHVYRELNTAPAVEPPA